MFTPRRLLPPLIAIMLAVALGACDGSTGGSASGPSPTAPAATPSTSSPTAPPAPATPAPSTSATPPTAEGHVSTPGKFVFPVVGKYSYAHTHHDYPATDIITNCGNEVRAATSGVILEVTRVDKYNPKVNAGATRGGLSVSIKGDDGIRYYGSHLEYIEPNIQPGVRVSAGEQLGKVGQTGDASVCHLHFGISPVCSGTGDWWIQRGVVYPWPYLDSWRKGGNKSPAGAIKAWQSKYGCPKKPLTDP